MIEHLKKDLLQGNYKEAELKCKDMDFDTIKDILITLAYDTESICVYSFVQFMIIQTKNASWIELAIDIMINPLCFIEGAYSVALFHSRELLFIEENVKNLERIIFFYNIPEQLIDEEEAKLISKKILKIEPNNEVALRWSESKK